MANKITEFSRGKSRKRNRDYSYANGALSWAKQRARRAGNRDEWERYKLLQKRALSLDPSDPQDPDFRRLYYVRYADDFLVGVIGSKADAAELKVWLQDYLRNTLELELSAEKTLITSAKERVRFLGYDIKRHRSKHVIRFRAKVGIKTQRIGTYQLSLLAPIDKTVAFANRYGETNNWRGKGQSDLLNLSELEILMTYNTEVRGFLSYYSLADNLSDMARRVMWLTSTSFFRTLANKRKSTLKKVTTSLKKGPNRYVVPLLEKGWVVKESDLFSSTRQLKRKKISYNQLDLLPNTAMYRGTTELGKRLLAQTCEWCGTRRTQNRQIEVHHVRKLADLKGKAIWERQMIERQRKTMVLCVQCHDELHAGKLRKKEERKS